MTTTNDIILRPRFKIEIPKNNETVLSAFQDSKKTQSDFIVNRIDDHVFIKFPKHKQHFWSPQLHLEINEVDANSCLLHGLFGPNPTVWTFFMFLHFMVAGLFIAFGIWAYSNWALKTSYAIQIGMMLLMVIIWVLLYFGGRIGKASGKGNMMELQNFMHAVLK
ncbi:GTP-binding protein [Mariniflexile sp.]|uniref:GTP-binding protein n=1 Tax=Mariniflexile sp. TaxID=1979402 RepID=UPI0040473C35